MIDCEIFGGGRVADLYTPDHIAEAVVSKESLLLQMMSTFRQANRCIPFLWKRLVWPVILARMEQKPIPHISCSEQSLNVDLKKVVKDDSQRWLTRQLLIRYDYIRCKTGGRYTAGTRLWKEVDARRMMEAFDLTQ